MYKIINIKKFATETWPFMREKERVLSGDR